MDTSNPKSDPNPQKKPHWKTLFFIALPLIITLPFVGFYLGLNYQQTDKTNTSVQPTVQIVNTQSPALPTQTIEQINLEWNTTRLGIEFNYPKGWHVINDSHEGPDGRILIGSKPFYTSTTHGPTSEIMIRTYGNLLDPNKKYEELISSEKEDLVNITEADISSPYTNQIHHVRGEMGGEGYAGGRNVEKYMLLTAGTVTFQRRVIVAELNAEVVHETDTSESAILRDIVLSIR